MRWWRKFSRLSVAGVFCASIVPTAVASTLWSPAATAAVATSSVVEDFAFPFTVPAPVGAQTKVIRGDGNITVVDCPAFDTNDALIRVQSSDFPENTYLCIAVQGNAGYLALEVPNVYLIEANDYLINATLRDMSNNAVTVKNLNRNDWTSVGVGITNGNAAVLLELDARKAPDSVPAFLPAPTANPSVGRMVVNSPGRAGSQGCSATLVAPQWVLSAASCFYGDMAAHQAGPPPGPTQVSFGGQAPRKVDHLVQFPGRDAMLGRLDVAVVGITPSALAATAPTNNQSVQAKGFGRTASVWRPTAAHSSTATVNSVTATTVGLTTAAPVCKGDAGGPVLNAAGEILAVVTGSGQQGCLAATATVTGATSARVGDLKDWALKEMEFSIAYIRTQQNGMCLQFDAGPYGVVAEQAVAQVGNCIGTYNQMWLPYNDGTIRNPQKNLCLDIQNNDSADRTTLWAYRCNASPAQLWTLNSDGTIKNPGTNKCADVDMSVAGTPSGTRVQLYSCNTSAPQKWDRSLRLAGEIRNPTTAKCLDVEAPLGTYGSGSPVQLWGCLGGENQKWVQAEDGTLRNPKTGLCLGLPNTDTANGVRMALYTCTANWNQKWTLDRNTGAIRNPQSGKCLDLAGLGKTDGTVVNLWDCKTDESNWNQKWTSFWADGRFFSASLNPFGAYDRVTPAPGGIRAEGWAIDPEWDDQVTVMVSIDGQAPLSNWKPAGGLRNDLLTNFSAYGAYHGFDITLPAAPGPHQVCVFAWNRGTGGWGTDLGCKTVTVS